METTTPDSVLEHAHALSARLAEEALALQALEGAIEAQMAAVHSRDTGEVRETTLSANERLHDVSQLHEAQEALLAGIGAALGWAETGRPASIRAVADHLEQEVGDEGLARRLREQREALITRAGAMKSRSESLAYTLQYALHLGRELIQAVQAVRKPESVSLYTPRGKTSISGTTRSIVNRMG